MGSRMVGGGSLETRPGRVRTNPESRMARRARRGTQGQGLREGRRTAATLAVCAALAIATCRATRAQEVLPLPPVELPPVTQPLPPPDGRGEKATEPGAASRETPTTTPTTPDVATDAPTFSWPDWPEWPDWQAPSFDWNPWLDWDDFHTLGPGATAYAFAEAVAFQRDNQSADVPLVIDTITGEPVLSVGQLLSPVSYGVRAFVGERARDGWGWEAGYLGVYGMASSQTVSGPGSLQLAGPLANQVFPFFDAENVVATYSSTFQSGEFNLFRSCCRPGPKANACGGCCIDWLGGFRYVNLTEQAGMTFTCCTTEPLGPYTSVYDVTTSNNLVGGQLGGRVSRTWRNWAVEGWAKAGVFANVQNQSQGPVVDPLDPTQPRPDRRYGSAIDPAMLADVNVSLVYRINRTFGVRVGYSALWAGNVALAPNQWNFGTATDAGMGIVGHGGLFLNGANLGIDACW